MALESWSSRKTGFDWVVMMVAPQGYYYFLRTGKNGFSCPCGNVNNSGSYSRDCGKVGDFSPITAFPQGLEGDNSIRHILS